MKIRSFFTILSFVIILSAGAVMAEEFGGQSESALSTGSVLDTLKSKDIKTEGQAVSTGQTSVPATPQTSENSANEVSDKSTSEKIKENAKDIFGGFLPAIGKITSKYGWRVHPIKKKRKFHEGVDISLRTGTPLKAIGDGVVVSSGNETGYGKVIVVKHEIDGKTFYTRYAHLSQCAPKGTKVTAGKNIPSTKSGNTGWSTGPHLHFEVMDENKKYLDPEKFI